MSKQEYINANNEIQTSEQLKKETLNKIQGVPEKRKYNRIYPIVSLAMMFLIAMSIAIPYKNIAPMMQKDEIKQTSNLPKVETFENFYGMMKKRAEDNKRYYLDDMFVTENSAADSNKNEHSETNNQVKGVEEADIVKTDGNYIYYLTQEKLNIIDVKNKPIVVSTIENDNDKSWLYEIYLKDDKLVLIGEKTYENDKRENLYMFDQKTYAKIYNIQDRTAPILERTIEIEGNYLSSRMIDDNIYLISNKYIYDYLLSKYTIDELDENEFKPKYLDTAVDSEVKCLNFDCIYYFPESEENTYMNIASLNIKSNEPANIESYLGAGQELYVSNENLYITKVKYEYEKNENENGYISYFSDYKLSTEIYKFKLNNAECVFETTGNVPGAILNQFSMDESNGYFRIATTNSTSWKEETKTNNLYILNNKLEIVGKVEDLAKGEKIYSVRFIENRAYMVTFVQTDPLFVIDLENPENPKVLGELKIPGYSKYLHPYDETHLIGFGENTKIIDDGYGERVVTDGMKIALFDVSDPNNPKELYNTNIGGRGTNSEILYNHKALLFSKEKNIIAFPVNITEDNYITSFRGAIIYSLDLEKGFELRTKITSKENSTDKYYTKNNIERIIYIGNEIYTLAPNEIKVIDMNSMQEIERIEL